MSGPAPADVRPPGRRPWGALVLGGAGALAFAIGLLDSANFTVDDTFISMRFAENAARGLGLVFNAGERVEGYSNLLWTLALTGLARLGIHQGRSDLALVVAAKLMGAGFAVATMALVAGWVRRVAREGGWGEHGWLAWTAILGLGTSYSFVTWSMSGMETPMCTFLLAAGVALTADGLRAERAPGRAADLELLAGGVAFALATLTRPEPVVVWGACIAATLWIAPPRTRRRLAIGVVPVLLAQAALLAWRHHYYGTWVPNTVVAKFGGGALSALLGAKYTLSSLVTSLGMLGLALLGLPGVFRRGLEWKFVGLFCLAYVGFVAISGGDWMPGCRFLVPALPALWLLGAAALCELASRLQPRVSPWPVAGIMLVLCAGSFSAERLTIRSLIDYPSGLMQRTWVGSPERIAIAHELQRTIPAGSLVATGECGFIPYFNPGLRILDVFGLMEPGIARLPGLHSRKLTAAYFMARRPDYYLMMVKRTSQGGEGAAAPSHPDGVTLLASPEFRQGYEPVRSFSGFVLYRRRS